MLIGIQNVGEYGVIQDPPPHHLPFSAWSDAKNVRMHEKSVWKISGEKIFHGTPTVDPYAVYPFQTPTTLYWVYAGLTKIYASNGATHTDISQAGDYNATADENWTGGNFGGVLILNNGVEQPQQWGGDTGVPAANLSNWPATHRCGAIRPFKRQLVAMDITVSGTRNNKRIIWSSVADPGAVPSSWDVTDPSVLTGETELAATDGTVLDCFPLGNNNIVYKEDAIHGMQLTQGTGVYRIFDVSLIEGLINKRGAVQTEIAHAIFGIGDLLIYNGQTLQSLVDDKMRRWIFGRIDSANYKKCFAARNHHNTEVWFCFPDIGATFCNLALIFNWRDGTYSIRDLPNIADAREGVADPNAGARTWDSMGGNTWQGINQPWGFQTFNPTLRGLVLARPSTKNLFLADNTEQFNGTDINAFVERTGLGVVLDNYGNKAVDFESTKLLTEFYPHFEGTGIVQLQFGGQRRPDAPIDWNPIIHNFEIGVDQKVNPWLSYNLLAIRIEDTSNDSWRLQGYTMNQEIIGRQF